mgnify:FL=1
MKCVEVEATSILWNGEKSEVFTPSRGVEQEDPRSPYLFVMGRESLSHMIFQAAKERKWKGMRTSRNGPRSTHLLFAADLLLCAEATPKQSQAIHTILADFCSISRQKINMSKTNAHKMWEGDKQDS